MYVHTMLFCPCTFSAVEQMILQNPGNAKITNEYLYNLLHTGALYGRKDIVSLAINKVNISFIHVHVHVHVNLSFLFTTQAISKM